MQRYFIGETLKVGETFELDTTVSKHWRQVLRAEPGAQAEFVDQSEHLFLGQLGEGNQTKILKALPATVELPVDVTILSGLPKQDKAEWIVQKATELGAHNIAFFGGDWSVARWQDNKVTKKLARLQKIAHGASEQSHRTHVPVVQFSPTLKAALQALDYDKLLVAYEEAAKQGEQAQLTQTLSGMKSGQKLVAVFGPEGGISPAEIETLKANDGVIAGLGPRILRTETAPLYLLAAASTVWELQGTL